MLLRLYDLAGADADRCFSPYCWRIRMALAHMGLPVETIPWRFTEKDAIARSSQTRVPVLVDGERWIADSWQIANYLEDTYPERATLFGGPVGRALSRSILASATRWSVAYLASWHSTFCNTSTTATASISAGAGGARRHDVGGSGGRS